MQHLGVDLETLALDENGRVILSDEALEQFEAMVSVVMAGGTNGSCAGTTNSACSNVSCSGSTNEACTNSLYCARSKNDISC